MGTLLVEPEWHSEIPLEDWTVAEQGTWVQFGQLVRGTQRQMRAEHTQTHHGTYTVWEQTLNTITPRTTKNILADVHTQRHTYRTQNPTQMYTQIPTRTQT